MINGIAEATMSRDEGWQFLMLGRSIERADMIARMVVGHVARRPARPPPGPPRCGRAARTRRSCAPTGASETEREAAEFLLLDRLFPRSIVHALHRAEECLQSLEPPGSGRGFDDEASGCSAGPGPSWSTGR